ncbi:Gibberellin-regulated protein 10 [Striga hermonthica]|uniref:Gibberellin-regulated protein 10 n=1 Tax=Striga hermonthica TaxID=68872 RepID=A0A9N7NFQ8_STRHE|nr:Gibberellin-regulated protein 10 [Striga hermonthica]
MKLTTLATLLLALLFMANLHESKADKDQPPDGVSAFCQSKCDYRCSEAGRRDRCLKYCYICCEKCHCVPSGTSGNKDECPCYRDWKTPKGGPKCP